MLDNALAVSEELREEKRQIEEMRNAAASQKKERFKPYFADRVMRRIEPMDRPETVSEQFFTSLSRLFRPVAVVGVAAVIIMAAFNVYKDKDLNLSSVFGIYEESNGGFYETPLESFLGI